MKRFILVSEPPRSPIFIRRLVNEIGVMKLSALVDFQIRSLSCTLPLTVTVCIVLAIGGNFEVCEIVIIIGCDRGRIFCSYGS